MFKFSKKNYFQRDIEPHEVLLDKLARKNEEVLGISEKKLEVPIFRSLQFFFYFSIFLFFLLFLQTFNLQLLKGRDLQKKAQNNRYIIHKIQAQRGVIYDRNFIQLVFNQEVFDLVFEKENFPKSVSERKKILEEISQILKIDQKELERKIEKENSPVLISENLDHQRLIILETKIDSLPGFKILKNSQRDYPYKEYLAHLIGYLSKIKNEELKREPKMYSISDYVGRTGIEATFEEILRKNPGEIKIERDALGNKISQELISLPQSGKSLVLWLDFPLQKKIYDSLQKRLPEIGSQKAAAVALDPKTGGVLSLLSLPSFDNNIFSTQNTQLIERFFQDERKPLFNRAIGGEYLIGSIIKPLIALGVLEEKIINPFEKIDCHGKIVIPNPWHPDLPTIKRDWTFHGPTDLKKAIAESCNVYFYIVGGGFEERKGLGVTKIKKYLELFNLGRPTGIELLGEAGGLIPDPEWKKRRFSDPQEKIWRDGDTYNLSIGQGFILATPLQIATAFSALVNGGKIFQPQLVQKIVDSERNLLKEIEPKIIHELNVDPKNLEIIKEGMLQAVTGENSPQATAVLLNSLPIKVGAKTGTAEAWQRGEKIYHTWITVFAPYENPEIVLTLMIEDVKEKVIEHQLAIVPVAKEILEWYFSIDRKEKSN